MSEAKWVRLYSEVAKLTDRIVKADNLNLFEVIAALGSVISLLSSEATERALKAQVTPGQQPEEGEEEEEEEGEFKLRDLPEVSYAFDKLASKYPTETTRQILNGDLRFPQWLRKEIIERRE